MSWFRAGLTGLAVVALLAGSAAAQEVTRPLKHTTPAPPSIRKTQNDRVAEDRAFQPRPGYLDNGPQTIMKLLLRQNRLNLGDTTTLRELAAIFACNDLQQAGANDFAQQRVLSGLHARLEQEKPTYPLRIVMHDPVYIDRYDFTKKGFVLTKPIQSLGTIGLLDNTTSLLCIKDELTVLPMAADGLLEVPLTVDTVPVPEDKAEALLQRLIDSGYPRRLTMALSFTTVSSELASMKARKDRKANFLLRLEHVDFFEDLQGRKLVYTYPPEAAAPAPAPAAPAPAPQ